MLVHLHPTPLRPHRVVVLGAAGFVGGAIVAQLAREGVPTLALGRNDLDLCAGDAGSRLAALLAPGDSLVVVSAVAPAKTPATLGQNVRMVESVCDALDAAPVAHVVYISSDAIYADDANPVTEASYAAPSTLHGVMHLTREAMLKAASRAPFVALRPTLIYGPNDPHNGYGPNRFRRQARRGEPIAIFGEGEEQRDHVYVGDVARIAGLVLTHRSSGAINVATGRAVSFAQVATMVAAGFGPEARVVSTPRPGPRPHLLHRFFDVTGCLKAFPRFAYTPLERGLALSLEEQGRG